MYVEAKAFVCFGLVFRDYREVGDASVNFSLLVVARAIACMNEVKS